MITISESAAFLWRSLSDGKTADELTRLILDNYEADEETVRKDINELIVSMCAVGAMHVVK